MNWLPCWVVLFSVVGLVDSVRHSLKEFEKLPHLRHWLHRLERQMDHDDPPCSSPKGSTPATPESTPSPPPLPPPTLTPITEVGAQVFLDLSCGGVAAISALARLN